MGFFGTKSSMRRLSRRAKKLKKNSGLSVHQEEPFLGVWDLKFENCQNKGHPNDY